MSSVVQLNQIHEAAHTVFYLRWGTVRGARSHGIRNIIIDGGRSMVRFNDYFATEFLNRAFAGDLSPEERQWYIQMTEPKLNFYLAGCAAEARHLGKTPEHTPELLKWFDRSDRSPNNDIQQAIGLNNVLGRQKPSDGVIGLIEAFNETLRQVDTYDEVIKWTAGQLEKEGVIEGIQLDNLVTEIQKRLNRNKE